MGARITTVRKSDGKIYGRHNATVKANIAVYASVEGHTMIERWSKYSRSRSVALSLEEARVLYKALGEYLKDNRGR